MPNFWQWRSGLSSAVFLSNRMIATKREITCKHILKKRKYNAGFYEIVSSYNRHFNNPTHALSSSG